MIQTDLKGRSLLSWLDYSTEEIRYLLELSKKVKKEGRKITRFAGITVACLFEKRSTRTRCSFETAVGEEGGHPVFLSTADIQLGSKESIEDTARTLGRMFSLIMFRGFKQSTVEALAKYSGIPVINGLTDLYHPTQVLADVMTIEESFGNCKGKTLCFVGDGRNNVANSLVVIAAKLGMNITIISPEALFPETLAPGSRKEALLKNTESKILITSSLDAVENADAIYTDVWASMGEEAKKAERVKLLQPYQVNKRLFDKARNKDCIFLHCLPAVRGEEVTDEVMDGPRSRIWDQAENRKHTIKTLMIASLGLE